MGDLSINSQWRNFVCFCARHARHCLVEELCCGASVCWTQSTMFFTNGFFLSSPVADELDLGRRLEAIQIYASKRQPIFSWVLFVESEWLSADTHNELSHICSECDFAPPSIFRCMRSKKLLPTVRPLPMTEIRFASSAQHRQV